MKGNKNTVVFQLTINWKHLSLMILHLTVFMLSLCSEELITTKVTVRALS